MILSIESSCDDSCIAITDIKTKKLIYHKKISQELEHSIYGGVVPELASRLHLEALPKLLKECKKYFKKLSNCLGNLVYFNKKAGKFSSRNPFNRRNNFYGGYIYEFNYEDLPGCAVKKIN